MRLRKKARNLLVGGAVTALGSFGTMVPLGGAAASASDTLPAYTADAFCTTQVINAGQPPIKGKTCTGLYKVTTNTYKFTEDALHACPASGTMVHLDERWISPPTGGDPTVLASYHAYLKSSISRGLPALAGSESGPPAKAASIVRSAEPMS